MDPDHRLGDQAEVALAAERRLVGLDTGRLPGRPVQVLEHPGRGHKGDVLNDVLDVAVAVALHAAGVGGDPPAEGGQLQAVGLVAAGEAVLLQQFLQPAAQDAGLDTGGEVVGVHPLDGVHPSHVERDHRPGLRLGDLQRVGDVGAAAVRDQADVVLAGEVHHGDAVVLGLRPHHQVDGAVQVAVEHP